MPKIAAQINLAFGTSIYKDVVRRILAMHYRPTATGNGPSWLTFIGHMKDSLWSLDLFRCESVIGFGIQVDVVDGLALCRIFQAGHPRRHHGSTIFEF
jgi:hypothetical protein